MQPDATHHSQPKHVSSTSVRSLYSYHHKLNTMTADQSHTSRMCLSQTTDLSSKSLVVGHLNPYTWLHREHGTCWWLAMVDNLAMYLVHVAASQQPILLGVLLCLLLRSPAADCMCVMALTALTTTCARHSLHGCEGYSVDFDQCNQLLTKQAATAAIENRAALPECIIKAQHSVQ